jgi:hypothetical protein
MISYKMDKNTGKSAVTASKLGRQPFHRDDIRLAFGVKHEREVGDGQSLAGSGALVFEGELLELPMWH